MSLVLDGVIGFGGKVLNSLKWHPDGEHVVYPLGSTVIVKNIATNQQAFLTGHTDNVTCITISKCGRYIATGQKTDLGLRAPIFLWDFEGAVAHMGSPEAGPACLIRKLIQHKSAIQAVTFSDDSTYLASLGGQDDNNLMVWHVESGKAEVCTPAGSHTALAVTFFHGRNDRLVTAGQYHVRSWDFQIARKRLFPEDWKTGSVKRIFTCLAIDEEDGVVYVGTSSGDVLAFNANNGFFLQASTHRYSLGVLSIALPTAGVVGAGVTAPTVASASGGGAAGGGATKGASLSGKRTDPLYKTSSAVAAAPVIGPPVILIGTGDGALAQLKRSDLSPSSVTELMGGISSIALSCGDGGAHALIGTEAGNLYSVETTDLKTTLISTACAGPLVDVVFPSATSELFITAGGSDIRIWSTTKRSELLRIQVPAINCTCIALNPAGTLIASGWDDGKIRTFLPESGRLQYVISDAHIDAVTCLAFTPDGQRLVTGGKDGRVRVWAVTGKAQAMEMSFKEHKKEVTSVRVSANGEEAISSSADGSCLIWNIRRGVRSNAFFSSTVFRAILYHPDESQLVTVGSDRKISYWDTTECTAIRVMDGSAAEILSVDLNAEGTRLVTAGLDKEVRVWRYDEGDMLAAGVGHAAAINKARMAPDDSTIVSVGQEGAIFIWRYTE